MSVLHYDCISKDEKQAGIITMLKQIHLIKAAVISVLMAASVTVTAVAAPQDAGLAETELPFAFEVSDAPYERLCYAGHGGSGIKYREGYTIPEDATFQIVDKGIDASADPANLKVEISVLYENDQNTRGMRETVRTFEKGDLKADGTEYSFFSDNLIDNLASRDRLYSNSLQGLEVKMTYFAPRGRRSEQYYYLVCSDDMMDDYASGAGEFTDETDAD